MGDVASIDPALLQQLLAEQRQEIETKFAYLSQTLAGLVTTRTEEWLLETGMRLLDSDRSDERILGTRLVRELNDNSEFVCHRILAVLEHEEDPAVIEWLLNALAFLGQSDALEAVAAFAYNDNAGVREAVATAISGCSNSELSPRSRDILISLAHDDDHEVRFSAVFELGEWWKRNLDVLIREELTIATRDFEPAVRRAAKDALTRG